MSMGAETVFSIRQRFPGGIGWVESKERSLVSKKIKMNKKSKEQTSPVHRGGAVISRNTAALKETMLYKEKDSSHFQDDEENQYDNAIFSRRFWAGTLGL